jgi:hypothetical protein
MVELVIANLVICGGVLISEKHVLIAYHCMWVNRIINILRLNIFDVKSLYDHLFSEKIDQVELTGRIYTRSRDSNSEGFKIEKVEHSKRGLSIIVLEVSVPSSQTVHFVNLIREDEAQLKLKDLKFVGWNSANKKTTNDHLTLQHIQMEFGSLNQCQKTLLAVGLRENVNELKVKNWSHG